MDYKVFQIAAEFVHARFGDKYLSTCRAIDAASRGITTIKEYNDVTQFFLIGNKYIEYFEQFMGDELNYYNEPYIENWGLWMEPLPEGREARVLALLLCAEELKYASN